MTDGDNKAAAVFMRHYSTTLQRFEMKLELLEKLQAAVHSVTVKLSDIGFSGTRNFAAKYDALDEAQALQEKLEGEVLEYLSALSIMNRVISQVRNAQLVEVLTLRYIKHASWRKIASRLQISERHAMRLNSKALAIIQRNIPLILKKE